MLLCTRMTVPSRRLPLHVFNNEGGLMFTLPMAIHTCPSLSYLLLVLEWLVSRRQTRFPNPAGRMALNDLSSLVRRVKSEGLSAAQWEEIGVHLGLPHDELKNVGYANPREPEICLIQVLSKWRNSSTTLSEEKFLRALK